jgi:hypothetical protein
VPHFDITSTMGPQDSYDVKPRSRIQLTVGLQIVQGQLGQLLLLGPGHGFDRMTGRVRTARFDFDKYQTACILGHQVDLSKPATILPLQDAVALSFQISRRVTFTGIAQTFSSPTRHKHLDVAQDALA